ncbi:MAG: ABC transporter permease [Sphingomonas sp.]|jgi:ABC-2 type transport system permease protein|uniref:ABC transporter permease n=1 Tax=Sphingomonas sp. TaxID=28214 RepID=UPI003562C159
MIRSLHAELSKLNGSLALLVLAIAPGLPGLLALLSLLSAKKAPLWTSVVNEFVLPLWAFFLLPMTVTAFATLVAQIEYKAHAWDHMLALPIARFRIFIAKAVIVLTAVFAMTIFVILFTIAGAGIGGLLSGQMPLGAIPWVRMARAVPMITVAASCFVMLQLWVALRFSSFVVPLAVGISGTLVSLAVLMTRSDKADWFPWVLPFRALTQSDPTSFLWLGGAGGGVVLAVMVLDLQRRPLR